MNSQNSNTKGLGYKKYNAVPPPYTGNFIPSTPDLSFTGLDEFVNEHVVKNSKAMSSKEDSKIMPPNMTTQSAGRSTATPRGGRTGGRTGRGSGRTRGLTGDLGNGGLDEQCGQVGGQVCGQGNEVNDGVNRVPDFITIIA
ncbi:hypothetical protein Tco_0839547 [Tanacetum coccineum]|uniref:Uncharacterized protein n=1 Tax=Tanacetum coccineum TaxID=301880 RepID=A0ABQ5ARJ9_9ASTR